MAMKSKTEQASDLAYNRRIVQNAMKASKSVILVAGECARAKSGGRPVLNVPFYYCYYDGWHAGNVWQHTGTGNWAAKVFIAQKEKGDAGNGWKDIQKAIDWVIAQFNAAVAKEQNKVDE